MSTSWDHFETFLAVMKTGSLSGAARELAVAQPTVRRRIEALEQSLGALLFTRATNGLVPTALATASLPHAESMAAAAHAMARTTSGAHEALSGTVRITTSEVMGVEVLPTLLAALRSVAPDIQVELALSNRLDDLLRRDADIAVRMVTPTQASLVARHIGDVQLGLFAHADYLVERAVPKTMKQLTEHQLIGADRDRSLIHALATLGLKVSPRDFAFRSDNDLAQLAALRAGLGIGICQLPIAERDQTLIRVVPSVAVPMPIWVVVHEDQRHVRRIRTVFDHLVVSLTDYRNTLRPGQRSMSNTRGDPGPLAPSGNGTSKAAARRPSGMRRTTRESN
jgi:DNA-binding transcriptional LysR family regulator